MLVIIWLMMVKYLIWLVVEQPTPPKNDGVSNSWDYDIHKYSQYMESHKIHKCSSHHQPDDFLVPVGCCVQKRLKVAEVYGKLVDIT